MQKSQKPSPSKGAGNKSTSSFSIPRFLLKGLLWLLLLIAAGVISVAMVGAIAYSTAYPKIPNVQQLTQYEPKLPLRIYSADKKLLSTYGVESREFVPIDQMPKFLLDALLAVEDAKFYEHSGVDFKGLIRATIAQITNPKSQGASTITMQLARNSYFTNEQTYIRKFYEICTSLRIESVLTKEQILEIYMNQIFLGHRSYGFASAARTYFGKSLNDLTLAESAMLAGLPQAPSLNNPISNPRSARARQEHVLRRMLAVGAIDEAQLEVAMAEPITLRRPTAPELHAEHAADEAQQIILEKFGPEVYSSGISVYTTIQSTYQKPAYQALRNGLIAYERNKFYRGPEGKMELPATAEELPKAVETALSNHSDNGELKIAVVVSADPKKVVVTRDGVTLITITGQGLTPVKSGLAENARDGIKITAGSIVRINQRGEDNWDITQIPEVEGSVITINPQTGAILAMVGGFDFTYNKFNHSTQAWRQPGSSFKPFVYSAALERGITANTILNDAPIKVRDPGSGKLWTPKNFGGRFAGRVPMHEAFTYSRNIPIVLTIDAINPSYAQQWIQRFSFEPSKNPATLTMALGVGAVTPLQMTSAYSVFANGGYQVDPYLIERIVDSKGNILYEHTPVELDSNRRVIPARNAFVMSALLNSSAGGAKTGVGRTDVYGKTGTTNDSHDTWFIGFHPTLVTSVWVGYDQPIDLGRNQTGSSLARPIWIEYMKVALKDVPRQNLNRVGGVSQVNGQWVYDEFAGSGGVRILGNDLTPDPADIPLINHTEQEGILNLFD